MDWELVMEREEVLEIIRIGGVGKNFFMLKATYIFPKGPHIQNFQAPSPFFPLLHLYDAPRMYDKEGERINIATYSVC